ncbi:MAG: M20/M25/M40 family metallo-hydrolase [Nitriliruptoraceae bacterium]
MPQNSRPARVIPEQLSDVADQLLADRDRIRAELEELIRIPSISALADHGDDVRRSAEVTAGLLRDAGLEHVELLEDDGMQPAVTGAWRHAGDDAPTVLLYAHHDVQPVGTAGRWHSDPFTPTEREGRLYGRGAADDKAGIMTHVAAIRAWLDSRGALPVNVKVLIEGEEEIGSPYLEALLERWSDQLDSDVIVLADLVNHEVGWPSLTYALRGMADVTVRVRTLEQPVHSGMWGGAVPDALTATVRLLASLHDDNGEVCVPGFVADVRETPEIERERFATLGTDPERLRRDVQLLDGVRFVGDPARGIEERLWLRPTITPTGMDVTPVAQASNTLLSEVTTKLSCRLAPGQDPERALGALADHLVAHAPFGAHVEVEIGTSNPAWLMEPDGPAWSAAIAAMTAAYGRRPAEVGCGGSIPFVEPFSAAFGGAPCLLVGVEDPRSNAHGEDESVHLDDLLSACLANALLFAELAARSDQLRRDARA